MYMAKLCDATGGSAFYMVTPRLGRTGRELVAAGRLSATSVRLKSSEVRGETL